MRIVLSAILLAAVACAPTMGPGEPPQQPQGPGLVLPERLRAVGTEPFWAALLAGTTLTYMTPEDQQGTPIAVRREEQDGAAVFHGKLAGTPLRLRIAAATCSDGMSDTVYPYLAELTVGGQLRRGCARSD